MIVTSDNRAISKELKSLEKVLVDNGAWIHSNVAIGYSTRTGLSVYMEGNAPQQDFIIAIPGDLLIPADSTNLSVRGNDIFSDPDVDTLSPVQLEIIRLLISIHNHTDKIAFFKDECPWIRFRQAPELMFQLLQARTMSDLLQHKMSFMCSTDGRIDLDGFVAESFTSSRTIGYKSNGTGTGKQFLMPIIDYMNHDYRGSRYTFGGWDNVNNGLRVQGRQPIINNRECYTCYGMYDGLDTFLNYGFYDRESPFIRSIPLEIPVEDIGNIIVNSTVKGGKKNSLFGNLANELQIFMPFVNRLKNGDIQVSDLFITSAPYPHTLRRILGILFSRIFIGRKVGQEFIIDQIKNAETMIISKNLDFYQALIKTLNENDTASHVLPSEIQEIAKCQLEKLDKYSFDDTF